MGNFFERIGDFIILAGKHAASFIVSVVRHKSFKVVAPIVAVAVVAIIVLVVSMPQAQTPDPNISAPVSSDPPLTSESPSSTPSTSPTPPPPLPSEPSLEPSVSPSDEPVPAGPVNPLTGLVIEEESSGNRPVAIMINNYRQAQPLLGVSKADILYEIVVEGGITRMLAIFHDVSVVGVIGSIRSSRLYFVDVAQSYDAIYLHAGGSTEAYEALINRGITRFDGVNGPGSSIFYRDPARLQTMSYESTMVTTGARILDYFGSHELRLTLSDGYKRELSFTEDGTPKSGAQAMSFEVLFSSGSKATSFTYNTVDTLYYPAQYGGDIKDGVDGSLLAVTNVLILQTSVSTIPGDAEGRQRVATKGTGTGYYVNGGKYVEITWSRSSDTSQFEYKLLDGSELVMGQGRTYICIISDTLNMEFS